MWDGPHICGQHPDSKSWAGLPPQRLLHGAQEAGLDLPQLCLCHPELLQALLHLGRNRLTSGQEPYCLDKFPDFNLTLQVPSPVLTSTPRLLQGWPEPSLSLAGFRRACPAPHHTPWLSCSSQPAPSSHLHRRLPSEGRTTHFLLLHSLLAPSQLPTSLVPSTSLKSGLGEAFSCVTTTDSRWLPSTQSQAAQWVVIYGASERTQV